MSLKKLFMNIIVITIVFLMIFQLALYYTLSSTVALQKNELIRYTAQSVENSIVSKLKTLNHFQSYVSDEAYRAMIDAASDADALDSTINMLSDQRYFTQSFFSDIICHAAFTPDSSYKLSNELSDVEFEQLKEHYSAVTNTNGGGLSSWSSFFVLNSGGYNNLYICSFRNIYKTNYEDLTNTYIVTSALCCKLNLKELTLSEHEFDNIDLDLVSKDSSFSLLQSTNNKKKIDSINIDIPDTDYELRGTLYANNIVSGTYRVFRLVLFETIFLCILLVVILLILEYRVTRPTNKIVSYIENNNILNAPKSLQINAQAEFQTILNHIYSMAIENRNLVHNILNTQQQLYETEIEKYKSDLASLENQINPHFLYNTLECVRSIAVVNNIREIEDIMVLLSDIMRYSVKSKNIVPFCDELDIVNKYFEIMKIRFPNFRGISTNIPEEVYEVPVPKMILQPIAENVFKHASSAKQTTLKIDLTAEISGDDLLVTVRDNGCGISPEVLEQIRSSLQSGAETNSSKSIGLLNVDKKIKLHFGNNYGVSVDSRLNEYTAVTIRLKIVSQ